MNNSTAVGTYYGVDWPAVTYGLKNGVDVTTDPSRWKLDTPGYKEIYSMWEHANFNMSAIKWTNYYPGTHFPKLIEDNLATYCGVTALRSWISRIDPGFMAPWHWDVDDNEAEYLKKGSIKRFSCFIENPSHGHIFILGNDYFYNQPIGTIVQWKNYKDWHSGINAGMTPKYMYHLLGY
jgi:hypothetical protein